MCLALVLDSSKNISAAKCKIVPLPPDAKFNSPGLFFSKAMNSRLLVAATFCGLTTKTMGVLPIMAMGVKSPGMSKGNDFKTLGKITTLLETTDKVKPSGAALDSVCKPTTPPAPG